MGLEKSPSLEDYAAGIPSGPPDSPDAPGSRFVVLILALAGVAVLAVGLVAAWVFLRADIGSLVGATGTVSGTVVDVVYRPLQADIYVQQTRLHARSDSNGYFEIRGVPAGPQSLVVAFGGRARAFPVTVVGGESVEVGQLRYLPPPR